MKRTRNTHSEKGVALVESAVTLLVFLLFMIAILEGARLIWAYNTLGYVAREGTRYATVRGGESSAPASVGDVETYVKNQALGLDPTLMTVTTTWSPNNNPGSFVQVAVSYQYSTMTNFFLTAPVTLSSTSRTVVLH
jgi:Flp pilus assembly protein TadG